MNKFKHKRISAICLAVVLLITSMVVFVTPTSAASITSLDRHVTIGYWNAGNGGTGRTLAQVDSRWDVINVSYLETRGNYYTPSLNLGLSSIYSGTENQQKAAFKADIQTLQARGQKVVISCGGQNGVVRIDNASQRDVFLYGVKEIINDYGFDGFDLDLEGSSISCMRTIKRKYRRLLNNPLLLSIFPSFSSYSSLWAHKISTYISFD